MNRARSSAGITSSILSNLPPQRSSTMRSRPNGPAPRTLPQDNPVIPGSKIILYVHGGGSKAEEAVDMANWFIVEGANGPTTAARSIR